MSARGLPRIVTLWKPGDKSPPPRGFTLGERLKVMDWSDHGWDCKRICNALNDMRTCGPKAAYKLPPIYEEDVRDLQKRLPITRGE